MGQKLIKRADGSYSKRGLWDNIRANRGSNKKPTSEMLEQEKKIKSEENKLGGLKNKTMKLKKKKGGFPDMNNDGKTTQADIFLKKKENGTIKKKGGVKKKKMYGGTAMKDKKGMGGKMMKYKTGGFTLEPKTPNLDDL
tara:strand:+ start:1489 stop:1905 length:417 start_codon:yes stop_codon:yes gene_type:complete